MKKPFKILFLSLIILTALSFFACGNKEIALPDNSEQSNDAPADESGEDESSESKESIPSECNHVYEEKVLVAATCQKEGITKKTCTLCRKTETITVQKAAHVEVEDKGITPTCTTPGTTNGKHCGVCNTVLIPQSPIVALGHTEIIDASVPATCTTDGKTEGKHCGVCNTVLIPQSPIAAPGHTEIIDASVPATCTTDGKTEGKHCGVCNTVLIPQSPIAALGHNTIKRTHTPVTCQANGIIEIYCTRCKTVQNYETILKGHYSADHEYASITHSTLGNLCVGYKHDDKCELCGVRFIAPGTYTVINFGQWEGTVQFKFDYYNTLGVKQSANKITRYQDDNGYWIMKFDDYVAYSYDTEDYNYKKNYNNIITITEKDFAIVDQSFYNVFLQYFEAGEYTLSGKYDFGEENIYTALSCPKGIQYLNFKYLDKNGNEYYSTFIQCIETSDGPQVNYSNYGKVLYFSYSHEWGNYDSNLQTYVIIETPQKVSKEFFEWFTSATTKIVV